MTGLTDDGQGGRDGQGRLVRRSSRRDLVGMVRVVRWICLPQHRSAFSSFRRSIFFPTWSAAADRLYVAAIGMYSRGPCPTGAQ
jgi:hypothetical protein